MKLPSSVDTFFTDQEFTSVALLSDSLPGLMDWKTCFSNDPDNMVQNNNFQYDLPDLTQAREAESQFASASRAVYAKLPIAQNSDISLRESGMELLIKYNIITAGSELERVKQFNEAISSFFEVEFTSDYSFTRDSRNAREFKSRTEPRAKFLSRTFLLHA
jgi:hypothetical protein